MSHSDGPIVDEIRERACAISRRFDDDARKYGEHLKELQKQYADRLVSQITILPARDDKKSPADNRDKA